MPTQSAAPLRRKYTLDDMRAVAAARGGECLSGEYQNLRVALAWQCQDGHRWAAKPDIVLAGTWCPLCAGRSADPLRELTRLAQEKGGRCVSTRYVNPAGMLRWRCARGHSWSASAMSVRAGAWCRRCELPTLDQLRALARRRGGECLAHTVEGMTSPLTWRCASNHTWRAPPARVIAGSWCRVCTNEAQKRQPKPRITLELAQLLARERGGTCLSSTCIGAGAVLDWRCDLGHTWTEKLRGIRRGLWCPECRANNDGKTIKHMQALAAERSGRCTSPKYLGCEVKLKWECEKSHEWQATPQKIRQGRWCPICANNHPHSLASMQALASQRGGTCLSSEYLRGSAKLQWRCAEGHCWSATATGVQAGRWCPICASTQRGKAGLRLRRILDNSE